MAAYDGSIRIDTRINAGGFNAGVKSMMAALAPLALLIAATFSVVAIFNFGKTAVQTASDMASSFIGLQSIVQGTGRDFTEAKDFINDYIDDGLVPVMNATTAYKNLLMRGFDDQQIKDILISFKNSAAFGRQASLQLGDAVQSATEGLKNENSILVDNAGVTKNVSLMWRDYAQSIGTTVGALTLAQKREAEYQGIMFETRFQMGDAAKLAGTYSGQISALGVSFTNLKVAIGNAIIPIIQAVLPYIKAAVDALTIFFNRVAQLINLFFGTSVSVASTEQSMSGVADATQAAADAQGNLAKNTEKAGKAAKGSLASFDQLNILSQPDTSGGGTGAGAGTPVAGGGISLPAPDITPFDEGLDALKVKVEKFKEDMIALFAPIGEAWGKLWADALPLITTLGGILMWLWTSVLVPVGTWIIQSLIPALMGIAGPILLIVNDILTALAPAWEWLWKNVLEPAFAWIGSVLIEVLGWVAEGLRGLHEWFISLDPVLQAVIAGLVILVGLFLAGLAPIALVIAAIVGLIAVLMNLGSIWEWIQEVAVKVYKFIANVWKEMQKFFYQYVILPVLLAWNNFWREVQAKFQAGWNFVVGLWGLAKAWFQTTVINPLVGAFSIAWNAIKTTFEGLWNGIVAFVKSPINTIIGFINTMIRAIVGGMNSVIRGINSFKINIPDWVPREFGGGQSIGFNLKEITAPQIPRLATGAVIPPNAEFLAMLGDQKSGRNIEAPENLIRKIFQEEMAKQGGGDLTVTMPVYLDSEKIYQGQQRVSRRRGPSLISGSQA